MIYSFESTITECADLDAATFLQSRFAHNAQKFYQLSLVILTMVVIMIMPLKGAVLFIAPIALIAVSFFAKEIYPRVVRRRIQSYLAEIMAPSTSHSCEIEITDEGIEVTQNKVNFFMAWSIQGKIMETADVIIVNFGEGRAVRFPSKLFSCPEDKQQLIATLQSHINKAKPPSKSSL
jgi:hypothetical protein